MSVHSATDWPGHPGSEKPVQEHNESDGDLAELRYFIGDYEPGSAAERQLLRKLDFRIIVSLPYSRPPRAF